MRSLRNASVIFIGAVVALAACKGTEPAPIYEFSGTYELQSMSGHTLPYDYACIQGSSTPACTMLGGQLEVRPDSHVVVAHYIDPPFLGGPDTLAGIYTYRKSGNRVILSIVPDGQVQEETRILNVRENSVQTGVFVYVKPASGAQ